MKLKIYFYIFLSFSILFGIIFLQSANIFDQSSNYHLYRSIWAGIWSFLIWISILSFEYFYYNSETVKRKFHLIEDETIFGKCEAVHLRKFLPLSKQIIITDKRIFCANAQEQGFSIWYHETENIDSEISFLFFFAKKLSIQLKVNKEDIFYNHSRNIPYENFVISDHQNNFTQIVKLRNAFLRQIKK